MSKVKTGNPRLLLRKYTFGLLRRSAAVLGVSVIDKEMSKGVSLPLYALAGAIFSETSGSLAGDISSDSAIRD